VVLSPDPQRDRTADRPNEPRGMITPEANTKESSNMATAEGSPGHTEELPDLSILGVTGGKGHAIKVKRLMAYCRDRYPTWKSG
jgi:hypothetical protein